ncbi:DUF6912 family protein [Nocardioides litoris]|uniref:DUF6912 family protein n=1 Tax=Nocardioides litoris TaxID=1926648 RepID=UPI001122726D|nr:hypothetical protein [Nocardioides litoris]
MTRLYVPLTLDGLRDAWAAGELVPGDDVVVAESDDEEAEYDALMTAADASAERLAGAGRRVVVVAEVSEAEAERVLGPGAGAAGGGVPLRRVVAVHADPRERPADADPDDDLAWYATQEVSDLLG